MRAAVPAPWPPPAAVPCCRTIHTLKLLPWAAMQTMVCLLSASVARNINDVVLGSDCQALLFTCNLGTTTTTYIGVAVRSSWAGRRMHALWGGLQGSWPYSLGWLHGLHPGHPLLGLHAGSPNSAKERQPLPCS